MWFNNIFVCTSPSVLRKLTVHGFQEPQQNIEVMVSLHSALTAVELAAVLLMSSWKKDLSLQLMKGLKAESALSLVQLKGLSSLALSATKTRLPKTANLILVDLCRLTRSTM